MKKHLLPESGAFYKANLHCHTTFSDGKMTPLQVKEVYQAQGYSIVAFTDHDVLVPHPELTDENFLPLNGFEAEVDEPGEGSWACRKTCHICFVAKDPENVTMPFYHREKYIWGNAENARPLLKFKEDEPDYVREYSHEGISDMMRRGSEGGFFVTYNHPTWSLERYPDYIGYHGMHAMEIMNTGCCVGGYWDCNHRVYDDFLCAGTKLFAIAADDNHGTHDTCGGWTMIKADKLDYRTITSAMEQGHFYSSWGPQIHELWVENGDVHVTCSPASRIICTYRSRRSWANNGTGLTHAAFPIRPDDGYLRITVQDDCGNQAVTNAYWVEDLL